MKKNQLLIPLFLFSVWLSGQTIFERYADNSEVTLVSISPKMFKMLGQMNLSVDDPEAQEYLQMVSSISNFKVLISSNQEISKEMLSWVNLQVSKQDLDELMSICSRIAVMASGRLGDAEATDALTPELIGQRMAGAA